MLGFAPFSSGISKVSNQLLFLCINRYYRTTSTLKLFGCSCNILKLQVPIRMLLPFKAFSITLQAKSQLLEQSSYACWRYGKTLIFKFIRQVICTFTCPSKWFHRVTAGIWLNKFIKSVKHPWMFFNKRFTPPSGVTLSTCFDLSVSREIFNPMDNCSWRDSRCTRYGCDTSVPKLLSFYCGPVSSSFLS